VGGDIVDHNHPPGNNEPSNKDVELMKRIVKAGIIIEIELLDHIVFS